jgi:PAS domain S-box-containing protein
MSSPTVRILHFEDSDLDAKLILAELAASGLNVDVRRVADRDGFAAQLSAGGFDLIIADFNLPQFDGLSALKMAQEICPDVPFIIVSGAVGETAAVEALKAGATDYVLKGRLERLASSVQRALREAQERRERRRALEMLRASEERFQIALKNSPIIVYTTDRELRYTWVHNMPPGFEHVDLIGKRDDELFPREDVLEMMAFKLRVLQSGQGGRREVSIKYDGAEWCFDLTAEPLRDVHGNIIGITVAAMDITQRKQAEREMRQARDLAEAANKAKDQFLAVLSHELRTPLSPVLLTVAAMEGDPSLSEQAHEDIEMIRRNVELEARLIDDLLDLSRVATGKLTLHREMTGVHALIGRMLEICRADITGKQLVVTTQLAAKVDLINADPARMQQVFWNVAKNAIKFTPTRGKITVSTSNPSDAEIEIRFTDSGAGIPPQILTRIFDAFEQGDPTITRQFGGLGLGLAISKAVIDLHGGSIGAESAGLGKGATFIIRLPTKLGRPAVHLPHGSSVPAVRTHKVLLVEDHVDTAYTLARLLMSCGYEVKIAHDVAEAMENAAIHRFDIIVSDLGLPDGTGLDLIRTIQKKYGTKGIALSGFGMDADIEASREAGFSEHLVKPVTGEQLEECIKRVLGVG